MKSQTIRILDVILIAPLMVYVAEKSENINPLLKNTLIFFGFSTLFYNTYNYLKFEEIK
jgi:hypothetical protein